MLHTLTSNDQKKRLVESATMQAYELPKLGPKSTHMLLSIMLAFQPIFFKYQNHKYLLSYIKGL
jgi:hypothetical protein